MKPPPAKTEAQSGWRAAVPLTALRQTLMPRSALRVQSDERLVTLVREGNVQAFEAIVERYRRPLLKYCGRRLGAARAEDVVQQTFLNAYRALPRDDRKIDLKPWLYSIAHNLAVNEHAKRGFDHEQLDEGYDGVPQPPQVFADRERFRSLIDRIEHLPPRQRSALVLREFEGRDYHEIAGVLGSTAAAATELARRARIGLRDALGMLVPLDSMRAWLVATSSTGLDPQRVGELVRGAEIGGGALKVGVATLLAGTIVASAAVTESGRHGASREASGDAASRVEQDAAGGHDPLSVTAAFDRQDSADGGGGRHQGGGRGERRRGERSDGSKTDDERHHGRRRLPGVAPFPPRDDDHLAGGGRRHQPGGRDDDSADDSADRPAREREPEDEGDDDHGGPGPSGPDDGPDGEGDHGGGGSSGPGGGGSSGSGDGGSSGPGGGGEHEDDSHADEGDDPDD